MFIRHLAVGFAAKRFAPKADLGWLLLSSEMIDLLFFSFFLLGCERMRIDPGNTAATPLAFDHYPWSHSLAATVFWAVSGSLIYWVSHAIAGIFMLQCAHHRIGMGFQSLSTAT